MTELIKSHDKIRLTDNNTNSKLKLHSEFSKEVAVKFGRFLLKEATHHWDKDATLCWKVANQEFDTLFLFDKFIEENFTSSYNTGAVAQTGT
jgi:hypothetical protein